MGTAFVYEMELGIGTRLLNDYSIGMEQDIMCKR